ncbi:MAG: hypothetical protein QE570_16465 [Verrucomicrobiota bacterium]|jgi:hypothetical protein|nr:hypothetical protein [Verrucomicrobiota bacterium]
MLGTAARSAVPDQPAAVTSRGALPAASASGSAAQTGGGGGKWKTTHSFAKNAWGSGQTGVGRPHLHFKDLFQKEQALSMAETVLAEAERMALAKKKHTQHTELVGSPLSVTNSRLGAMFRHLAAEFRIKVIRQRDAALRVRMGKIAGDNHSLAYFQSQGDTAVVIALAWI